MLDPDEDQSLFQPVYMVLLDNDAIVRESTT